MTKEIQYTCEDCGASGVKLWRESNKIATLAHLRCAICASKRTGDDISEIDCQGRMPLDKDFPQSRTDQIGYLVPAVQNPDKTSFYGYGSAKADAVAHWRSLPTLPLHAEYIVEAWVVADYTPGFRLRECEASEVFYAHESHQAQFWAWKKLEQGYFVRMWRRSSGFKNEQ